MKNKIPTIYLLRNRRTQLYSCGGTKGKFGPFAEAKIWRNRGDLLKHLKLLMKKLSSSKQELLYANLMLPELDILEFDLFCPTRLIRLSNYPLPHSFAKTAYLASQERKII